MFLEGLCHKFVRPTDTTFCAIEMIPWIAPTAAPKRGGPKGEESKENAPIAPTLLDQYLNKGTTGDAVEDEGDEGEDIVMNEDGTMTAA